MTESNSIEYVLIGVNSGKILWWCSLLAFRLSVSHHTAGSLNKQGLSWGSYYNDWESDISEQCRNVAVSSLLQSQRITDGRVESWLIMTIWMWSAVRRLSFSLLNSHWVLQRWLEAHAHVGDSVSEFNTLVLVISSGSFHDTVSPRHSGW